MDNKLLAISFFGIVIVIIIIINNVSILEKFLVQLNPDNDGRMKFSFLVDPNYTNSRLTKYYINDDIKYNGNRLVQHPYQNKHYIGINGYYGNYYSNLLNNDNIYKEYKIRL